jgi:hypothetical protein
MSNKTEATFHGATEEQVHAIMEGGYLHTARPCQVTRVTGANFDQCLVHGGLWGERGCSRAALVADRVVAAGGEVAALRAEIERVEALCEAVERNPLGWGGPMVVSFARTVRAVTTGEATGKTCGHHPDLICGCGARPEQDQSAEAARFLSALAAEPTEVTPPAEQMCPNCVTPWKCNGPHVPAEQRDEACAHDVGDPPEVCRCLLPRGHSGLHSCKHTEHRAEDGA